MNKTKIEWTDFTWNPITGCLNGCEYCYARRIYQRFKGSFQPQFHMKRLSEPMELKRPATIFVCSVSDFWGEGVSQLWRDEVYKVMRATPQHIYQILTKQPQNIIGDYDRIPDNVWVGTTIDDYHNCERIVDLILISHKKIFVSFEPMLTGMDIPDYLLKKIKWVIIGGLTGKGRDQHPVRESWINNLLIKVDRYKIPVFMKNNLKGWDWSKRLRREFPQGMTVGTLK